MLDHYCINCDQKVPIWIRTRRIRFPLYKKDGIYWAVETYLVYEEKYAVCQFCGREVYDPKSNDQNIAARAAEIRKYKEEQKDDE